MRIIDFGVDQAEPVDAYESHGAEFVRIAYLQGDGPIDCMYFRPGAVLGRHPTGRPQLFCVVTGEGRVTGQDGVTQSIRAGQAALWDAGEHHESASDSGMMAIILQVQPSIEPDSQHANAAP